MCLPGMTPAEVIPKERVLGGQKEFFPVLVGPWLWAAWSREWDRQK